MFSPIAQRSFKVRFLHFALYLLLIMGGLSMVVPFLIMISGSVEPRSETRNALFPTFFFNRQEMWSRYLSTKYQETSDLLRMAWNKPDATFASAKLAPTQADDTRLWHEFIKDHPPSPRFQLLGFLRSNTRMPSYSGRQFRLSLLERYEYDLKKLNGALGTQFPRIEAIVPPVTSLVGDARPRSLFIENYDAFVASQPPSRLIAWNAGGYFRSVFLPGIYGHTPAAYNAKHGTFYKSYTEIPFPGVAPETGGSDWFFFVSKVLSPDFVELTPAGLAAQTAAGLNKQEFLPTLARPEHVRVVSLDVAFSEWAATRGVNGAQIPQPALDREAFEKEEAFWKWQFLTMNYQRVIDEIVLHGNAIRNTIILVLLCVGGALIVNPLAAYALSRFKLRKTYHILLFCLATIAFPAEVTMIPIFLQMKEFHLLNTFAALVLPSLANGFSIFLLKGFFDSLPKELFEAAELDGANEWTMFWQITMTLSRPILAVIALGAFNAAYGTFFYALILAPNPKMWTVMVYIFQLRSSVDYPVVYASLILTAIPTLLVFIFCQNIILRGIVVPSDK
jgi:multiple sugar transport system permease protein